MGPAKFGTPCMLILALALAGCGNNEPASDPRAQAPVPTEVTAQVTPLTQANRFDGRWTGHFVLRGGAASGCAATHRRAMVVQNGVAAITYNRALQSTATGEIQPDGRVTLLSLGNQAMRLEGLFEGTLFTGSMDSGGVRQRCQYDMEMAKRS